MAEIDIADKDQMILEMQEELKKIYKMKKSGKSEEETAEDDAKTLAFLAKNQELQQEVQRLQDETEILRTEYSNLSQQANEDRKHLLIALKKIQRFQESEHMFKSGSSFFNKHNNADDGKIN